MFGKTYVKTEIIKEEHPSKAETNFYYICGFVNSAYLEVARTNKGKGRVEGI